MQEGPAAASAVIAPRLLYSLAPMSKESSTLKPEHGQPGQSARPGPAWPENGPTRPLILALWTELGLRNLAQLTRWAGPGQEIWEI
jgi:hypothetical protein